MGWFEARSGETNPDGNDVLTKGVTKWKRGFASFRLLLFQRTQLMFSAKQGNGTMSGMVFHRL